MPEQVDYGKIKDIALFKDLDMAELDVVLKVINKKLRITDKKFEDR